MQYNYYHIDTTTHHHPFGMEMPGRSFNSPDYRFGFNGKEKDDEWNNTSGATYDYGFRIYDSRIARFLSVDPLIREYPWYTPYQFAGNSPIWAIDLDGLEPEVPNVGYKSRIPSFNDYKSYARWSFNAALGPITGHALASILMNYYLGNVGAPLNFNVNKLLAKDKQAANQVYNQMGLIKENAINEFSKHKDIKEVREYSETENKVVTWDEYYYAFGGSTFTIDATYVFTPNKDDNSKGLLTSNFKVTFIDSYTWDKGKSTVLPGGQMNLSDNDLKGLNLSGLAREFYMGGSGEYTTKEEIDLSKKFKFKPKDVNLRNIGDR